MVVAVPSRSGSRTSHTRKYQARAGQGAWSRTGLIGAALQVSSSCCADGMGVPIFGQICSIADPPRADESRGGCGFQAGGRVGHSEAQVMRRISGGAGYQRSIQLPLAADQGAADAAFCLGYWVIAGRGAAAAHYAAASEGGADELFAQGVAH
eukprot:CAMPEP_0180051148 /NCGR_PEP_ID=MMETSP0985-20121206/1007_1 /TAXON_ID=483367 /ORGANISM="non described non described, Strain CCMP 2436" /LENGTH=152 /DNA_ID=CAMNT_0021980391 /DNA_START=68 /DNA_END=525 /DNA_ORIENTATION=+